MLYCSDENIRTSISFYYRIDNCFVIKKLWIYKAIPDPKSMTKVNSPKVMQVESNHPKLDQPSTYRSFPMLCLCNR